jgi:hypothetical protein
MTYYTNLAQRPLCSETWWIRRINDPVSAKVKIADKADRTGTHRFTVKVVEGSLPVLGFRVKVGEFLTINPTLYLWYKEPSS